MFAKTVRVLNRTLNRVLPYSNQAFGSVLSIASILVTSKEAVTSLWLQSDMYGSNLKRLEEIDLETVKELNLSRVKDKIYLTQDWITSTVSSMPNLTKLTLPNGGSYFQCLPEMKFLKQLEFEEPTKILELHYLIRHPSLEAIEISWASKLKDEDLLYLKNIPNLKKLHLGFAYSLRSLAGLAGAQKLTELEISFACFTSFWETSEKFDLIDITPQNFPELTSLDLSVDRLAESGISSLKEMKNLTYLKVHVYKDPPFDWSPLKNHPSLRRVHVTKDDVKTPSFWKTLATWPRIEMVFGDGVHALTKEQRNELAKKNIVVGDFGITKNPISSYRR